MEPATPSRNEQTRRRRLPRISLRLLLVVVALCSLSFAWIASATRRQKAAIATLAKHNTHVTYAGDASLPKKGLSIREKLANALTPYVDIDLLLPVTEVRTTYLEQPSLARGARYSPVDVITVLADLPSLERARLTHSEIRNEDLASLEGLRHLRHLDLSMTRLNEGALSPLDNLDLVTLSLSRTRVNDDGLECVAKMTNLEFLNITRTKVTGNGLRHIESLPNLKTLRMQRCLVSRDDYERFKRLRPDVTVKWSALVR